MAVECLHVRQVSLAEDKSFLNPRAWSCSECGFTDSVWACLLCHNVACGRDNYGHALMHFTKTKHPLAVEVNKRYVHCYLCDDYILNDNSSGDISLVQTLLDQVASQQYQSRTRSGHVIRGKRPTLMRRESRMDAVIDNQADKLFTAQRHWRSLQLTRVFAAWRRSLTIKPPTILGKRKPLLTPGLTGLRNLGNTCYMNSVLQSLGHLVYFRETFKWLVSSQPVRGRVPYDRQTTFECYENLQKQPVKRRSTGGLKGGRGSGNSQQPVFSSEDQSCLCKDMHALMRVMWSGKWAMVTPHAVLNAIWSLVPGFSGYSQQDAQEFLCELLDVLQSELSQWPVSAIRLPPLGVAVTREILPALFQGKLVSKIVYSGCQHKSLVQEPFWDLSLDLPLRHQDDIRKSRAQLACSLKDLLDHFTTPECLDGSNFTCSSCERPGQQATKQLLLAEPPDVLRLHIKRFRWTGRSRHKLLTHIEFPLSLSLEPYVATPTTDTPFTRTYNYDLVSVIIHHGTGFNSGHYTCYCWNSDAGSWVHFNDVRVGRVCQEEVLKSQAYILFYTRKNGLCNSTCTSIPSKKAKHSN